MQKGYWILCLGFLLATLCSTISARASENSEDYHDDDDYVEEDEIPAGQPVITSKSMTIEIDEGKTVRLPCQGEHLQHFALMWEKDGTLLAAGEFPVTDDKRFSLAEKALVLVIDNVTSKDSGEYMCKTSDPKHPVQLTHRLLVRGVPRVSVDGPSRVVKENEPVTLSCNVTGYPEPTVFWERKGKKMPTGEQVIEGKQLTFSGVSRHHTGIYECFANSSIGTARTAVNLVVKHAPEIEIERESVNSGTGSGAMKYDAELVCLVHAEPKAQVVWLKDGRPIQSNRHHSIQKQSHHWTLHITDVQEDDFGKYVCVANNSLGRVHKNIELSGKPSQPILRETNLGKDHLSYNLVWILESAIEVDAYKLRFRKVGDEWGEQDVKGEMTPSNIYTVSYTLADLTPSTDYEATLIAHNKYGWSLESRVRRFHINGEFQSLEAETSPNAKGAMAGGSVASGSLLQIVLALFLSTVLLPLRDLRWQ